MALAVVEADRFDARKALQRPGQTYGGILPAGKQDQSGFGPSRNSWLFPTIFRAQRMLLSALQWIEEDAMAENGAAHGMIAVDKMGAKILFLDPATYETEMVLDGFQRTVHELLVVPETGRAYVPIFGDGIHGRNPESRPHCCACIDLEKRSRCSPTSICGPISRRTR